MTFTKNLLELSKRVAKIYSVISFDDQQKLVDAIRKSSSFDDLPKWAKDLVLESEIKIKNRTNDN